MKKDKHKLIIDRSKWLNGSRTEASMLLNKNKNMCCLGFLARSCGLKSKDIKECSIPSEIIAHKIDKLKKHKFFNKIKETPFAKLFNKKLNNSKVCGLLITINDDENFINEEEREKLLKKEFKKIGVDVSFVGKWNE